MKIVALQAPIPADPPIRATVKDSLASLPTDRVEIVQQRLDRVLPALEQGLTRLYGAAPARDVLIPALVALVVATTKERDADLWRLDLRRETDPGWHQRGLTGYCTYVDRFGGTIEGVEAQIPYLQDLGVTYLHLLPFLKAGTAPNDGGFAVASFDEIEPALGDMAALRQLCAALRRAGISLCSDLVLNHVSHEHAWARAARAGDPRYLDYFHWKTDPAEIRGLEALLPQVFPATAPGNFSWVAERQAWVWTTFYPYQWDLNYANPAVFLEMAAAMLYLANQGVEAFRLDSTGFLWKRAGTNCLNQPEVHLIVQAFRSLVELAAPAVLLKAEAIMPTRELPPYFGLGEQNAPECHLAYHSSLMAAAWLALTEQSPDVVAEVIRNTPDLPLGCSWLTYVRCHDDIGWNVLKPELAALGSDPAERLARAAGFLAGEVQGSYARGQRFQASNPTTVHGTNGMSAALVGLTGVDDTLALERLTLLYSLAFFIGGLPLIYMGDELGMGNATRADQQSRGGADTRDLHRPTMDPGRQLERKAKGSLAQMVFQRLRGLQQSRLHHLELREPVRLSVRPAPHPALLLLQRNDALGLFNFSSAPLVIPSAQLPAPPERTVWARVDGQGATGITRSEDLAVGPYGALWLAPQADVARE